MSELATNIFGTDGIRDRADQGHLAADSLTRLGVALAQSLAKNPRILIGRDTRVSGSDIEHRMASALLSKGASVVFAGIVPTPAISMMLAEGGYDMGLVISASHNPPEFNGVKVFGAKGAKLNITEEERITDLFHSATIPAETSISDRQEDSTIKDRYLDLLIGKRSGFLRGLKVVLDCAKGATATVARVAFERAGAEVVAYNEELDGSLINVNCGSTNPEALGKIVVQEQAALGVAFDGDGDRAILVDEQGAVVDGDEVMALWALDLKQVGQLPGNLLVSTVMSNAGMESYLKEQGIELLRTDVGDREVYHAMLERSASLGGEQSGHIIYLPESKTGDGIRTGMHMASLILRSGKSLSKLRAPIPRFPQTLVGVEVKQKIPFDQLPEISTLCDRVREQLKGRGRLLLRYSGTEPLARILIEGPEAEENLQLVDEIASALKDCLALH